METPPTHADFALDRRAMISAGGIAATIAIAGGGAAVARAPATPRPTPYVFDDPRANVRAMARLTSTLEPGKTGFVRYQGKAFALLEDGRNVPLFDIDGIGALRALPQDDGSIRFLFNEFALFCDSATGLPLDRWTNPITRREVDVWHLRNGPVNYALSPDKASFGSFTRIDGSAGQGFQLPWIERGPFATFALDVVADRPNPLDPKDWPLESTGPTLPTTEHSQYTMLKRDLADPRLLSLPFVASLQSLKPWHPWMLMGQRPGRIFTRTVAEKVAGPEALPPARLAYARANLAPWMAAPDAWTGTYVTQQSIYKSTRKPQQ